MGKSKTFKRATFRGVIETKQPFFHDCAEAEKSKKENTRRCLKMYFAANGENGDNGPVAVPIISPNTIRAILRDNIAMDIAEKVGEGKLDYLTLLLMFSGGIIDKDKKISPAQRFQEINKLKQNNIVVRIFGGAASVMIPGKLTCLPGILICKETSGFTGNEFSDRSQRDYIGRDGLRFIRREDAYDTNINKFLSEDGFKELIERMTPKKKEKGGENGNNDTENDKKTSQMIYGIEDYVVAGARFYHMLEIFPPNEEEIGAIYSALARFAERPVLGSFVSKGFGLVDVKYDLEIDGHRVDTIRITSEGFLSEFEGSNPYLAKYREYLNGITVDKISVPEGLK